LHGDFENFLVWLVSVDPGTGMHGIMYILSRLVA
jgi:hypothetical protein